MMVNNLIKNIHYLCCPVAGLSIKIKDKTGRTSDGSQGVSSPEVVFDATDSVATVGLGRQSEVLLVGSIFAKFFDDFLKFFRFHSFVRAEVEGPSYVVLSRAGCHVDDSEPQY